MFTKAIFRKPGLSMINGLTTSDLGLPDYNLALIQHANYVAALKDCGLDVFVIVAICICFSLLVFGGGRRVCFSVRHTSILFVSPFPQ